ncbi:hypothetical protein DDB_G0272332 [Dictyostelium discoideum AX4]|uniref:Uncharacterized protein n=1 Tax=Dictyostelium discoideum TaxID=44689 RepID=Q55A35_DICDI|nr:hypothetical protein DDB_G0272332 [Dictyostelium discoideum AX4]EAL71318.1 hypothetical protein DDB_G0272332 [Dictyostelium discoideum AX4]|eukprot:XP_645149.1 hypothetical protein DDB_G0272332 [Dictyostelium discoideum AX4]
MRDDLHFNVKVFYLFILFPILCNLTFRGISTKCFLYKKYTITPIEQRPTIGTATATGINHLREFLLSHSDLKSVSSKTEKSGSIIDWFTKCGRFNVAITELPLLLTSIDKYVGLPSDSI